MAKVAKASKVAAKVDGQIRTLVPNSPDAKVAIVGVSRGCFSRELTATRTKELVAACRRCGVDVAACKTIIENENDAMQALAEAYTAGANAAVVYLGNFGPEGPLSIFAEQFDGPVMAVGASEETKQDLFDGRGDAYCGMLERLVQLQPAERAGVHPADAGGAAGGTGTQDRALRGRRRAWCWEWPT